MVLGLSIPHSMFRHPHIAFRHRSSTYDRFGHAYFPARFFLTTFSLVTFRRRQRLVLPRISLVSRFHHCFHFQPFLFSLFLRFFYTTASCATTGGCHPPPRLMVACSPLITILLVPIIGCPVVQDHAVFLRLRAVLLFRS